MSNRAPVAQLQVPAFRISSHFSGKVKRFDRFELETALAADSIFKGSRATCWLYR